MELTELVRITRVPNVGLLASDFVLVTEGVISLSSHHFIFSSTKTAGLDMEV